MPLSTVLGAQSLIKPGVCTTATRPASPYEGQMIYDTDVATTLVWDGSAWKGTSGLTFITGASFTTATSVSLPTGTFSATYKNYKVIFDYVGSNTTDTQTLRLRASGTDVTASGYYIGLGIDSYSGGGYNFGTNAGTNWTMNLISTLAMQQEWLIGRPQETANTSITGTGMVNVGGVGNSAASYGGFYAATTSVDSLSLIIGGGATVTGFYRVYGLADS